MLLYTNGFTEGYNEVINVDGNGKVMMMDVAILKLSAGNSYEHFEDKKEAAFLPLSGKMNFAFNGVTRTAERNSVYTEVPYCLHVSKNTRVVVTAETDCEVYIQRSYCDNEWEPVWYNPEDVRCGITGKGVLDDTMHRNVRTIFDYDNAPYSNMVLGEVISLPGRWSGYPPHNHPQPEAYYYRFDHPQGFGAGFVGENVYKLKNDSILLITPNETHPQVTAPGYAMLTIWGIRHLDGNPWINTRTEKPEHQWMLKPGAEAEIFHE